MQGSYGNDFDDEPYIPSEEEQKEIDEVLNKADKLDGIRNKLVSTRKIFVFSSDEHFIGWLRTNGIKW